jgi:hypothetical protein
MSQRQSSHRILAQAKEREKKYNWLQAVESYKEAQASVLKQKNYQEAGEIQERIGFCFQNAAMQAKSREEFREKMRYSIEAYKKASDFYEMPINNKTRLSNILVTGSRLIHLKKRSFLMNVWSWKARL